MATASWPGNIRQLYNVVEYCEALAPKRVIPAELVRKALPQGPATASLSLNDASEDFEREYLTGLMRSTRGNVSRAAQLAKRNRTDFYRLLHRHTLEPGDFKGSPAHAAPQVDVETNRL